MATQAANDVAAQKAQAQVNGILKQDEDKNRVAVHSFDPNATPQEKAAAAGKGASNVLGGSEKTTNAKGEPPLSHHYAAVACAAHHRVFTFDKDA